MIELITGTPGSGKTTFAVAVRLVEESKRIIKLDDEACLKLGLEIGTTYPRRLIVAGVRGLALDHERLPHILTRDSTPNKMVEEWNRMKGDADSEPVHERLPDQPALDVPPIMQNWWLWCKPGDLIVIDEAQFVMPRGSMGRKPPYWLQAMEIHRHYGVDFIIITQHPQLIDTTVRALVGMHRHVRSVMGSPVCMVYVWDHASNPERYQMANKTTFVRRAKHFRLFNSTVANVKPASSGRWGVAAVPVLLAIGLGGLGFKVYGWTNAKPAGSAQAAAAGQGGGNPAGGAGNAPSGAPGGPGGAYAVATSRPRGFQDVPALQGCYAVGDDCRCIGVDGRRVRVELAMCKLSASSFDGLVQWAPRKEAPEPAAGASAPRLSFLGGGGAGS